MEQVCIVYPGSIYVPQVFYPFLNLMYLQHIHAYEISEIIWYSQIFVGDKGQDIWQISL